MIPNFEQLKHLIYGIIITVLALLAFLIFGCKASEKTKEVERTNVETSSLEYISKPIETNYTISNVCDSLGNLKPIDLSELSGDNKAIVKSDNNSLSIELATAEAKTKIDTIYETEYKYKSVDEVRYKTPLWMWLTIIGLALLVIVQLKYGSLISIVKSFLF